MSRRWIRPAAALVLLGPVALAFGPVDAAKVMQEVDRQSAARNISLKAVFEVYQANGTKQSKRVEVFELNGDGLRRTILRFLTPQELNGVTLLSVEPVEGPKRQWFYAPATERMRPVGERENSESFAGTDFTYEDLQPAPATSFTYKVLSDSEKMNGHAAYKLERRPKDPTTSQYAYAYVWVARDIPCILFEEFYNLQQQPVRTLAASQFKKLDGLWGARRMDMRTVSTNSHTVLTIEEANTRRELTPAMFTPEAITREGETAPK